MRTVEMRKERWRDLYRADGRTKVLYQINCKEAETVQQPPLWPEYKQERIEWAWKKYLLDMEKAEWLEDDTVPHISMVSGTEIYAEAFGAKVHRPDDNMPFAIPFIFSPQDAQKVKVPRLEDSSLMRLFDIADVLYNKNGEKLAQKCQGYKRGNNADQRVADADGGEQTGEKCFRHQNRYKVLKGTFHYVGATGATVRGGLVNILLISLNSGFFFGHFYSPWKFSLRE